MLLASIVNEPLKRSAYILGRFAGAHFGVMRPLAVHAAVSLAGVLLTASVDGVTGVVLPKDYAIIHHVDIAVGVVIAALFACAGIKHLITALFLEHNVANTAQNLKHVAPKDLNYPFFARSDVIRPSDLVFRVLGSSDSLSSYVRGRMAAATLIRLKELDLDIVSDETLGVVLGEINNIIQGPLVYRPGRFKDVGVPPDLAAKMEHATVNRDIELQNRRLFELGYANELRSSPSDQIVATGANSEQGAAEGIDTTSNEKSHIGLAGSKQSQNTEPVAQVIGGGASHD